MKLKELSAILGLSQTTVSRALNGFPEVSATTRDRVRRAAEEHNYRPNRRALGLATGKTFAIGHVIPVYSQQEIVNPVFAEFLAGASETYNRNGYELLLSIADAGKEEEVYRSIVAKGAVDGVIVQMPQRDDTRIELLNDIGIPFVIHGRVSGNESNYSWIDINNQLAFQQATQLLVDLGHRRIGLINGNETLDFAWARRQGFLQTLKQNQLASDAAIMSSSDLTETHGYEALKAMLALSDPPTAFVCSSYIVGLGANRAILESGLTLGEDISIVIHDDELTYFHNSGAIPLFTGTRSSVRNAGKIAAEMLLEIIDNPALAPQTRVLESHLIMGRSTGPPKSLRR